MNTILEKINHLNQLVVEGKMLDAFDLYYHDDVSMQENAMPATAGKAVNRMRELQFLDSITEFRGANVLNVAAGDNVSFVTWHYDYSHIDWGEKNYTQVSVQHWENGKIIKEQFFYGN